MARTRTRRPKVTKEQLHDLVDKLPNEELHAAKRFLEFLQESKTDPFLEMLRNAPLDDEPTTTEEEAAVTEALEDVRQGRVRPWEEVREDLVGKGRKTGSRTSFR